MDDRVKGLASKFNGRNRPQTDTLNHLFIHSNLAMWAVSLGLISWVTKEFVADFFKSYLPINQVGHVIRSNTLIYRIKMNISAWLESLVFPRSEGWRIG
jgi:hypothetical protein